MYIGQQVSIYLFHIESFRVNSSARAYHHADYKMESIKNMQPMNPSIPTQIIPLAYESSGHEHIMQIVIPGYTALLSLISLLVQLIRHFQLEYTRRSGTEDGIGLASWASLNYRIRAYQALRFMTCLTMMVLTALPASHKQCVNDQQNVAGFSDTSTVSRALVYVSS